MIETASGRNQNLFSRQDAKHAKKTKAKTGSNLGDLGVLARSLTSLSRVTSTASCERYLPRKQDVPPLWYGEGKEDAREIPKQKLAAPGVVSRLASKTVDGRRQKTEDGPTTDY
jgi:hypothetical protein